MNARPIYKSKPRQESVTAFQENPTEHAVMCDMGRHIANAVCADAYRVFKLFPDQPKFVQYFVTNVSILR